ncbi:hypothetical protein [Parageobacillus thermoglucosidasius]|uniref:Uncharacterized protein n=2 Tax=Anoxybacillaceae TaxID=3120669 RepID=A0AAN1D791_PARTM|nr:hypothetical protein [Parageobacillus thermoglucosidasius]ALF10673.1 hypothetical protein AOT13_11975 [Parageobacillus thermoglucosidasius]ANZ30751.1 hypothetical protein BCV53_11985 [Parageobacillus thermoglucosidasius]APM81489.1 hypothetical protein BCV54_11995 [Parageobacillus thermoglucosidasius]KJX69323.1 hypothetical protein WH82_07550 [Parageobacillus thermoglucosidasius]RDE22081.1 hypothetical protein DV712_18700 [Parageobacillus thermoglucosidasius]
METSKFILHGDILIMNVKIDDVDYTFGIRWKAPKKPYDETWELVSYVKNSTGEKDLSEEQIKKFIDAVNPKMKFPSSVLKLASWLVKRKS